MLKEWRARSTVLLTAGTPAAEKTVVVLGAYRGGTSLIAAVLKELGVFMGETFHNPPEYPNWEDTDFQNVLHVPAMVDRAIHSGSGFTAEDFPLSETLESLVAERNRQHRVWGWKYPGTILWLLHSPLITHLRNPHFVTVFRDPLAIWQHELDVGRIDPQQVRDTGGVSFQWVSRQVQWLSHFAQRSEHPHLLVSYERLQLAPQRFREDLVDSLIAFLGPALEAPQRQAALAAIMPASLG